MTDIVTSNFFLRDWLIAFYFIASDPTSRAPTPTPNAATVNHDPLTSAAFGCFTAGTLCSGVRASDIAAYIRRREGGRGGREVNMLFSQ